MRIIPKTFNFVIYFLLLKLSIYHILLLGYPFEFSFYLSYLVRLFQPQSSSSPPEVFLQKGLLKICSKFTGEHEQLSCEATLLKSHFRMGVLL